MKLLSGSNCSDNNLINVIQFLERQRKWDIVSPVAATIVSPIVTVVVIVAVHVGYYIQILAHAVPLSLNVSAAARIIYRPVYL